MSFTPRARGRRRQAVEVALLDALRRRARAEHTHDAELVGQGQPVETRGRARGGAARRRALGAASGTRGAHSCVAARCPDDREADAPSPAAQARRSRLVVRVGVGSDSGRAAHALVRRARTVVGIDEVAAEERHGHRVDREARSAQVVLDPVALQRRQVGRAGPHPTTGHASKSSDNGHVLAGGPRRPRAGPVNSGAGTATRSPSLPGPSNASRSCAALAAVPWWGEARARGQHGGLEPAQASSQEVRRPVTRARSRRGARWRQAGRDLVVDRVEPARELLGR